MGTIGAHTMQQHTIRSPASCEGIGVHSGAPARVRIAPAEPDAGISFRRTDILGDGVIPARADFLSATELGTSLKNTAGAQVATVEHFLSACAGLGVDNAQVEIEGPELPILDGSAGGFARVLLRAGLKAQAAPRRRIRVTDRIETSAGGKWASLTPLCADEAPTLDVTIRFTDPAIGVQRRIFTMTREAYLAEIADARTFGFLADVAKMHAAGLGRGASLENAVVVDQGRVLNAEGLRYRDEFVRHKILDAVGDLALAGAPLLAHYAADMPGHALNTALVRALLAAPHAWEWDEGASEIALAQAS